MYPILFSIGDTPIHAYGLLLAVALILGWVLSLRFAKADKLPADVLGTGYVFAVGGGLIAARAMWLGKSGDFELVQLVQLQAGGLSGFGGVLVGLVIAGVYCQNKKIPPWPWLDAAAPAFLIGVVIERVAAYLSGSDFGHYVEPEFFLAVQFPAGSPVHVVQQAELSGLGVPLDASLTVHPSQMYAAVAAAIGVGVAFWLRSRRRYSGQVALFTLGYYGVVRYLIEDPFRYDPTADIAGPVTLGQLTALAIVGVAIGAHISRTKTLAENPTAAQQWNGGPWTPGWGDDGKGKKKKGKKKTAKKTAKKQAKKTAKADAGQKASPEKPEKSAD